MNATPAIYCRGLRVAVATFAGSLLLASWQAAAATLAARTQLSNVGGAGESQAAAFSHSGNSVLFLSEANNLVANDDSGPYWDLFLRDLTTGRTVLISVDHSGYGGGSGHSESPSISADEKLVAFHSAASNLVLSDTNGVEDVFVRDLSNSSTKLISQNFQKNGSGAGASRFASLSANGRFVVFESLADNLVTNDFNHTNDVFIHDLQTGTTRLVSVTTAGLSGNGASDSAVVTPDGRYVAFVSRASNLAGGSDNSEVYLRDCEAEQTILASANVGSYFPDTLYRCLPPVISGDGRVVVFKAAAVSSPTALPNDAALVFRYETESGVVKLLSGNSVASTLPQLSADGRFVAYEDGNHIVRFDASDDTNEVVSRTADLSAHTPVMTPDGSFIAFLGASTNSVTYGGIPVWQLYLRDMTAARTELISTTTNGLAGTESVGAIVPFVSDDGKRVLFDSRDAFLVEDDRNQANDVFVRERSTQRTSLVSSHDAALGAASAVTLSGLRAGGLSSNGQVVAFMSVDNNLVGGDTNKCRDVFVSDLNSGRTISPTVGLPGRGYFLPQRDYPSNYLAKELVLSGNGKVAAFTRTEGLRSPSTADVYVYDLESGSSVIVPKTREFAGRPVINYDGSLIAFEDQYAPYNVGNQSIYVYRGGTNYLASINAAHNGPANNVSRNPLISEDSRFVLFRSVATDLTPDGVSGDFYRLFAHDLTTAQTRLLSFDQFGNVLNENVTNVVSSVNSRYAVFQAIESSRLYRFDLQSTNNVSELIAADGGSPSLSADGRLVSYESNTNGIFNIFVKDMESATVTLLSANQGGEPGNNHSRWPQMAPNGRFVVFSSRASNLVENDKNNTQDIFLRDLPSGVTTLLSRNLQGTAGGNGSSSRPLISADSRTVVFQSFAGDLVPHDYNRTRDIFVVRLGSSDTDGDGLDDDWELAYFNTLERNGTGDFDGDGKTDREEFLAGTDPANSGSVLRVLAISRLTGGPVTLIWSAVPGKSYRVEYKDEIGAPEWQVLEENVRSNDSTASANDQTGGSHRFYRVVVNP